VFADAIDELLGMPIGLDPIEPEPYEALLVLQTQTVDYLEQLGQQLPKVGSLIVEGGAPVSALLLAYRRYGATPALGVKLDELLAANPEIDPLGVEPGTVLAVLG
jgi:prophage DNA circulation protein